MNNEDHSEAEFVGSRLPHNLLAEESLIGGMLLSEKSVDAGLDILVPEDFYSPAHGTIFSAMRKLYNAGQAVEVVSVAEILTQQDMIDTVGGVRALVELQAKCPSTTNAGQYAGIIKDKAKLRKAVAVANSIQEGAMNLPEDVDAFIDQSESLLFEINGNESHDSIQPVSQLVYDNMDRFERMFKSGDDITGLRSGFVDFDLLTSGLQPNALNVLGARPSMGKSALAVGMALQCALRENLPCLMFSLEMGSIELTQRMLCHEARLDSTRVKNGNLFEDDWDKIFHHMPRIADAPLWIDDNPNLNILELRSKARRIQNKTGKLGLVIVDYLQLMAGTGTGNSENRQQEVSNISRGLKLLSRELEAPVLALSQLNRGLEARADKRPMLSDLRESGSLEQDADIVAFLYRDEQYNEESEDKGLAELIIAKHRNGPTGTVKLAFFGAYTRFASLAKGEE